MGLAEESAHSMTFELDGESRTLLVGDAGTSAGTSFVRRPGSDETYVLSSNFNATWAAPWPTGATAAS